MKQDDPDNERCRRLERSHQFQTPRVTEVTAERPASGRAAEPAANSDGAGADPRQAGPFDDGTEPPEAA